MSETRRDLERQIRELPGLKEEQLVKLGACVVCRKPLLGSDNSSVTFYRVTVEHAALDVKAIERRIGLGMAMGSSALAAVMGPNDDLAKIVAGPRTGVVHERCATELAHLGIFLEHENDDG